MLRDESQFFPTPTAHALSLLESCDGDLDAAWSCAWVSARAAVKDDDRFRYWSDVMEVLEGGRYDE